LGSWKLATIFNALALKAIMTRMVPQCVPHLFSISHQEKDESYIKRNAIISHHSYYKASRQGVID